ncbi:MAG: OmpW family outer membrane protein [Thiofilum sp.]|uniref:OmpW/AlkL family protein n=1 Tax=Thiofilum sp. TaxID=2212733 RepID=UPI0026014EEE|nr:OmpW family outer membrane protein [Thiofilum sp.]MBK8452017.1 outer membrane beta-barrel protein [Thiofilum sp.]
MKKAALALLVIGLMAQGVVLAGGVAGAKNGVIVRVGAAMVAPHGDGLTIPAGRVEVGDNTQLGLSVSIPVSRNLAVGVLAATPFKHDISLGGTKVGTTKHLPPTVTLQYRYQDGSNVVPYVGAGINYTKFFKEQTTGALAGTNLNLDDSVGAAAEIGVDWKLSKRWGLNMAAWYADIESEATLNGAKLGTVKIDPWVYMVGASYHF